MAANYPKMNRSPLSELGRRTAAPPIRWLMDLTLSRPRLISLAAGFTDNASLPVEEVRGLFNGILSSRRTGQAALQYGSTQGDPALRRWTARHIRRLDRAPASSRVYSPERLIVTNGSQQLLYLVAEALCDTGDIVLVEDPTYFVYLGILQSRGLRARAVRMEHDGLDPRRLEQVLQRLKKAGELPRVKLLYLVSYFQNPTAITTGFEKKSAALDVLGRFERAAGHPIYLLEDAGYRELRFRGRDVKSALAVRRRADRVIYMGTYSKPFATGARVAFGFLPEPVFTAVLRLKGNHDFGTSNLLQQLLARALSTGRYERHLARLQARYGHKARQMSRALKQHFPAAVEWREPAGGMYFWARLPRSVASGPTSKLFRAALAHDVLYVPGELCYADDPTRAKPDREMRISFGNAAEKDIRAGIARLGAVLHKLLGR